MVAPLVSVVIPTYRHQDHVLEAIESALGQSYPNLEIIVVNDGSPDRTADVVRPLVEAGKIRYLEQANQGQAAARNRGIEEARGTYIAMLDDDDYWASGKLSWQVQCLEESRGAVVAYGQAEIVGQGAGTVHPGASAPEGDVFERFLDQGWIRSPGQALIRADVLKRLGGLDRSIWGTDDWDLWLRLSKEGEFLYRPKVCLYYREHANNASRRFGKMYKNGTRVVAKHLGRLPAKANCRQWLRAQRFVRRFTSFDGLREANRLIADRRRLSAVWTAAYALWIWPLSVKGRFARKVLAGLVTGRTADVVA